MTVAEIITLTRSETHTTTAQFSDATLLSWLNIVYRRVVRKIMTEVDENYFNNTKTLTATTSDSYALESDFGQLKSVKVKYGTSTTYMPSTEVDFSVMPNDYEFYATSQPQSSPVHQIVGTSLFIAPRFTSSTISGTNQIIYTYEQTQTELQTTTTGTSMALPVDFDYVLVKGIKPMVYSALGKTQEKNDAKIEFEQELDEVLYLMRGRDNTRNNLTVPDDYIYQ